MISCKQATELISKSLDEPLSALEKLRLRFHMRLCKACVNFKKQASLLKSLVLRDKKELKSRATRKEESLSPASKKRIKENLKKKV